ncbi:MAG: Crp/Fnr family transcriptional regulator [Chloroflexi bacterium]|nr:Crp/Fnr family transcriptional regulator [Chloroflexota bacterium]
MVSPELLRRYPFFAELEHKHIVALAKLAKEENVDVGYVFFNEGDELDKFYIVLEGAVSIFVQVPDPNETQNVSGQLMGDLKTKDIIISTVGTGNVFGWSALIAPHHASSGAKALIPCHVIVFDTSKFNELFKEDCVFGFRMMQKAAQVVRERLRDMQMESLGHSM